MNRLVSFGNPVSALLSRDATGGFDQGFPDGVTGPIAYSHCIGNSPAPRATVTGEGGWRSERIMAIEGDTERGRLTCALVLLLAVPMVPARGCPICGCGYEGAGTHHSLFDASLWGDTAAARKFLTEGADVDARNQWGVAPLHVAALIEKHGRHQRPGFPLDLIVAPGLILLLAMVLRRCRPHGTVERY
jgi:hypothetical protein